MNEKSPKIFSEKEISKESVTVEALQETKKKLSQLIDAIKNGEPIAHTSLQLIQTNFEQAEKHYYETAFKDSLTGLLNRHAFKEILGTKIERAKKLHSDRLYAFYIDLDKFKSVNDVYGHDIGDLYLKIISTHIRAALRPDDALARMGGDEFIMLCFIHFNSTKKTETESIIDTEAEQISQRIYQALDASRQELNEKVKEIFPSKSLHYDTGSVGYSFYNPTDQTQDTKEFIANADKQMYQIKKSKRGYD